MGLFGSENEKAQAQALAPQWLKIANDCANLVNKTTNPEVFFNRYDTMLEMMDNLSGIERYVKFKGIKPHIQKQQLIEDKEQQTTIFIDRAHQKAKEDAATKTTEKGEKACMGRFFQKLEKYYPKMTDKNISYIESLKKEKVG